MNVTANEEHLKQQKCLRCGHTWWPRQTERPRVCPKCQSAYWDAPRKREAQGEKAEG